MKVLKTNTKRLKTSCDKNYFFIYSVIMHANPKLYFPYLPTLVIIPRN